jgi:hypothetical protein
MHTTTMSTTPATSYEMDRYENGAFTYTFKTEDDKSQILNVALAPDNIGMIGLMITDIFHNVAVEKLRVMGHENAKPLLVTGNFNFTILRKTE